MAATVEELQQQLLQMQGLIANMQVLGNQASQTNIVAQQIPAPEKFSFIENDWEPWLEHYERYRITAKLNQVSDEIQINNILLYMGPKVSVIFERLQKKQTDFRTYATLIEAFNQHFQKKVNVIYERAKFNQRKQKTSETATDYIHTVITLAKKCKYGNLEDELIRDRLIVGIRDQKLSEALQLDDTLTLTRAVNKIKQAEAIKDQNDELRKQQDEQQNVDRVQYQHRKKTSKNSFQKEQPKKFAQKKPLQRTYEQCRRCGAKPSHQLKECPALKSECNKCGLKGHYRAFCRTRTARRVQEDSDSSETEEELAEIKVINKITTLEEPWSVKLKIGSAQILFKIDTGADATILSKESYELIKNKYPLKSTKATLVGPGKGEKQKLETAGKIKVPIQYNGQERKVKIYVVNTKDNLLGRPALKDLGIVQWKNKELHLKEVKNEKEKTMQNETIVLAKPGNNLKEKIRTKFKNVFEGIGQIKNHEYEIAIDKDAEPYVITAPRRVPIPLLEEVRKELNKMVEQGVIEKINQPTDWCAPMVVVRKRNGKIRICTDYTKLNKFVKRERFQLPAVEETLARLQDGKIFSKLDCSSGFWQLKLTNKSRKYTTFITPYGRFVYKRCPFGISSAPEVFQKTMSQIMDQCGLKSVIVHADDIFVSGKDQIDHDKNLITVLKTIEKNGLTLNIDKCEFGVNEIKYLGYKISDKGIKPDSEYVKAIVEYTEPKSVSEVRRFLGMVTYLTRFIKDYSTHTHVLRELLHKNNQFTWGPEQQNGFDKLKELISSVPVLASYNTNFQTRIGADASAYGIGGVLEQLQSDNTWRPVCYCSKSLSQAEQRYAQIEKECLAIVFTCNRLSQFLIGKKFEIKTDHKPLISILMQKPINDLTPRLQNFRMKLSIFNYEVTYVPGKELFVPDALSRAPLKTNEDMEEIILSPRTKTIATILTTHDDEIRTSQENDESLKIISKYVKEGWPKEKNKCNIQANSYYKYRNGIAFSEGMLVYEERIIIPQKLQGKCLKDIHTGHLGIPKCKARARMTVWWPGITGQLIDLITNCETCLKNKSPKVEPLLRLETPTLPWHTVGTDLFEYEGKSYLVIQDYYSLYLEVTKLKTIESKEIIEELKKIFSRFGIPKVVRSDNGRQLDSIEFEELAKSYQFKWKPSSPKYSQSNGLAESAVKTAKSILKKSDDFNLGLLAYRNTPLDCGASPSQLLMGRILRERIPIQQRKLKPKTPDHKAILNKKEKQKHSQKVNYDRRHRVKDQRKLEPNERVWVTDKKAEGTITAKMGPRSYSVTTDKRQIRRNRRHLQPLPPRQESKQTGAVDSEKEEKRRSNRKRKIPGHLKDFAH